MARPRRKQADAANKPGQAVRAIGYARVSTEEQAQDGTSLAFQEESIRAYCRMQGWELADVLVDGGVSGKSLARPGMAAIRSAAAGSAFDRLVFLKLDRLSRRVRDLLSLCDELEAAGVGLVSIRESIDTATASGRLFRTVLGAVAEFERDTILDRTAAGLRERVKAGGSPGGPVPFGFKREGARFLPDPNQAPVVRDIYRMRAGGATLTALASSLNTRGHTTRKGGRWYASTVRHVLENPTYCGVVSWGERLHVRPDGVRAASKVHTPVVSQAEWDAAQRRG